MRVSLQFFRHDSIMHRMDPLSKLIWIFALGAFGYILSSPSMLALLVLTLHLVAFGLGRIPFRRYARSVPYFAMLGIATGFFQVLIRSRGSDAIFQLGPFGITASGLSFGATFGLRVILISFASLIFIWTTDPRDLIVGFIYLKIPYRIAYAVFVALRFVPLLENEAAVIREAQAVRGVEEVRGRVEALKRYAIPLLASGIRRAEAMAIAMDSRAFGAYSQRTFIKDFAWTVSGLVFLLGFGILGGLLIASAAQGGGLFAR